MPPFATLDVVILDRLMGTMSKPDQKVVLYLLQEAFDLGKTFALEERTKVMSYNQAFDKDVDIDA